MINHVVECAARVRMFVRGCGAHVCAGGCGAHAGVEAGRGREASVGAGCMRLWVWEYMCERVCMCLRAITCICVCACVFTKAIMSIFVVALVIPIQSCFVILGHSSFSFVVQITYKTTTAKS